MNNADAWVTEKKYNDTLESEPHEIGVEGNGHQKVTDYLRGHGVDGDEDVDLPEGYRKVVQHYHDCSHEEDPDESSLEGLDDARHFLEEGRVVGFL